MSGNCGSSHRRPVVSGGRIRAEWTPSVISDTLCRLATGGGFAVRQLYTDQDEVLFDAARPVILNGIEDIVTRPDLADRAVFLTLDAIPEESRRPEQELWATFEAERPRILGALLDAVVEGLATLPQTKLEKLPRMADHQSPDAVPNPTKPPSRDYKRTCEHCPPAEAESAHDRIACDPPLAGGVGRQSVQVAALA